MNRRSQTLLGFLAVGLLATAAMAIALRQPSGFWNRQATHTAEPLVPKADPASLRFAENWPIGRGDTLADLLANAGIEQPAQFEMVAAVSEAFDVRKFRAGSALRVTRDGLGGFRSLEYVIDPDHKLQVTPASSGFLAAIVEIPSTTRETPVCGTLEGSLFESMERTGERPELAVQMAEIFAWDLDFYKDPQPGDEFCIVVEKKEYQNGQPPTYGKILAAKYVNAGTPFDAYRVEDEDGKGQYYSHDGRSLQAAFLRSPLKFEARVSSHFSRSRFHPVLHRYRAHLGTDYAAPTGTGVHSVASGRVVFSGYSGGSGNLVRIEHANGFETQYLHLSRRLVRAGQKVDQGERVGLVGSTGLATGPHLDFRIRKNGKYMNFERLRLPRVARIPPAQEQAFFAVRDRLVGMMDSGETLPPVDVAAASSVPSAVASD